MNSIDILEIESKHLYDKGVRCRGFGFNCKRCNQVSYCYQYNNDKDKIRKKFIEYNYNELMEAIEYSRLCFMRDKDKEPNVIYVSNKYYTLMQYKSREILAIESYLSINKTMGMDIVVSENLGINSYKIGYRFKINNVEYVEF